MPLSSNQSIVGFTSITLHLPFHNASICWALVAEIGGFLPYIVSTWLFDFKDYARL